MYASFHNLLFFLTFNVICGAKIPEIKIGFVEIYDIFNTYKKNTFHVKKLLCEMNYKERKKEKS